MSRLLLGLGILGSALVAFVGATRDPEERLAVAALIGAAAVATGSLAALALLRLPTPGPARGRGTRNATARALRRGTWIGAAVGFLAVLRAVDGLTLVTGGFVVAAFVVAEFVLTSRSPTSR